MNILGLTGGIGSGKTTVAGFFEKKGYAVYNSDFQAKEIMTSNEELKKNVIRLLGEGAYVNNELNKTYIANKIFSDKELLYKQNKLVHEAVKKDFDSWVLRQQGVFCAKESAILFESGAYKICDFILVVTASEEVRIQRAMERDKVEKAEIIRRMDNQWKQERLIQLSDFQIENNSDLENIEKQVDAIIKNIISII